MLPGTAATGTLGTKPPPLPPLELPDCEPDFVEEQEEEKEEREEEEEEVGG